MRRPFAVIGFSYILALIAASYAGLGISAALAVICAVCAAVVYFIFTSFEQRKAVAAAFCAAAAAFSIYSLAECFWYNPAVALSGQAAQISGVIADEPAASYGRYIYIIKADKIVCGGKQTPVKTKIRLSTYEKLPAEPFDRITANVTLSAPKTATTSGYNSRAYYKSKGIYLTANAAADKVAVTKESKKPPYYYAIKLRRYISDAIDKYVGGKYGALAAGILIGDTSNLPAGISDDFTATGITHLLAVSGTQTSLIMEYLMLLLCALRLPRRPAAAVTAAAIVVFMAVTGFSPSVMRAGIMSLVCLAAVILNRDADTLNSLGFSAFALCLINPYAATDIGLLLSLSATLGMVTISKRMKDFADEKLKALPCGARRALSGPVGILCETVGASVLTYPIIMLAFRRVSVISLAANIVEVPAALFVTLATAVVAILSPARFLIFLIKPVAILIRLCCAFMIWFAHLLASLPFASISASYGFVDILVVFGAAVLTLYFAFKGKGADAGVCVSCTWLAVAVGVFSYTVASRGVMSVSVLSNSGGAVVTSGGHAVVIDLPPSDYYPESRIESYLKQHNIRRIDAVVLTSYDKKRARSLSLLESALPVEKVFAPQNASSSADIGVEPERISVPSQIFAPYGVTITMLPDKEKAGMIALVCLAGSKAVVTGGGDLGDYTAYNPKALKADLLVFGGDMDEWFINAVSPQNAAGGSDSSAQTLARLLSAGADINTKSCSYLTRGNGSYKLSN